MIEEPVTTGEQERLRAVLQTEWDPIGVAGVQEASDEYDRYLPAIIGLLDRGASARVLADHLLSIERDRMGAQGDADRAERVARRLTATASSR